MSGPRFLFSTTIARRGNATGDIEVQDELHRLNVDQDATVTSTKSLTSRSVSAIASSRETRTFPHSQAEAPL